MLKGKSLGARASLALDTVGASMLDIEDVNGTAHMKLDTVYVTVESTDRICKWILEFRRAPATLSRSMVLQLVSKYQRPTRRHKYREVGQHTQECVTEGLEQFSDALISILLASAARAAALSIRVEAKGMAAYVGAPLTIVHESTTPTRPAWWDPTK